MPLNYARREINYLLIVQEQKKDIIIMLRGDCQIHDSDRKQLQVELLRISTELANRRADRDEEKATANSMPQESPLTMQISLPFARIYTQPHNDVSVSRRFRGCGKRKIETEMDRDRYRQIGTDRTLKPKP